MTDTAQPLAAAETEVASNDPIADAAQAFRNFDNPPDRPRDDAGRFVSAQPEEAGEEIEAEGAEEAPEAESLDETETVEAAEEAQPEAVDLPTSWPSEQAELWQSLPPETQAFIAEREGQRDAAVNAKFQEAANLRKAHEVEIEEAKANRQQFADAADFVLSLVKPQEPPETMLDPSSGDYNPDQYHLLKARHDRTLQTLSAVAQQRQQIAQQQAAEEEQQASAFRNQVEEKFGPLLLKDAPELADPAKQGQVMGEIIRYAIDNGVPEQTFTDEARRSAVTSADLRFVWKAMQFDKMMAAKAQVKPKAAKPAAPPVRPGVATTKSAVEAKNRKQAMDRLAREGSIEAGAAVFKNFLQGR